jgi:hypothetical protein
MPRTGFWMKMPDGSPVHVYGDFPTSKPCAVCGRSGGFLCDFPTGKGTKTCDRSLCRQHAIKRPAVDGDIDYCPEHAKLAWGKHVEQSEQGALT